MFGWLKRKRSNEQKKLLYQNLCATDVLKVLFEDSGDTTTVNSLRKMEEESRRINLSAQDGNFVVSPDDAYILLDINRELRRLFDQTATRHVDTFDNVYKPTLGWDEYYKSWEE